MIANMKLIAALFIVFSLCVSAFHMQTSRQNGMSIKMSLNDFKEQLAATAAKLSGPGMRSLSFYSLLASLLILIIHRKRYPCC